MPPTALLDAAQLHRENVVPHHAAVSDDFDVEAILAALRIGEETVSDKTVAAAEDRAAETFARGVDDAALTGDGAADIRGGSGAVGRAHRRRRPDRGPR